MKILLALCFLLLSALPAFAGEKETAFERIMKNGTVRCGYWVAPPLIIRDPNTGAMSGAYVEFIEALGKSLDLKIEWTQELNLGTYLQDLNQGKIDLECGTGWPNALRGKQVEYSNPVGFLPMYVYTKGDNKTIPDDLEKLNDPEIRFAGHDGGTNSLAQQKFFPKSKLVSIVGDAPATEPLDMVKFGKADVTMVSSMEGNNYLKNNPDSIRLASTKPVRVIPITISIPMGEFRLQNMLNTAINEMLFDGTIEGFYKKYDIDNKTILRVAKPYEAVQ